MKKKICIILVIILIAIIIVGIITNYADSGRVTTGHEPKYCIKVISNDGSKVTYYGLGYKVIRYVEVSPNEPYESNKGAKMGSWFMKYDLPEEVIINIEYEGQTISITDTKEVETIKNILLNSKYNGEICNGINTYKITINSDVYYIKEDCKEIQKGDKQATISIMDLDTINNIISNKIDNTQNKEDYFFYGKVIESTDSCIIVEPNEGEEIRKSAENFEILFYDKQPQSEIKAYKIIDENESDKYSYDVYVYDGNVNIRIDSKDYSLKEALLENKITMEEIIAKANQDEKDKKINIVVYKDGGTTEYHYENYTIIKCHSLEGNRDVYIGNKDLKLSDII